MKKNIIINKLINVEGIVSLAIGGSRSRNQSNEKSDWDLFCLIQDNAFEEVKKELPDILKEVEEFIVLDYSSFQMGWGFLFYGISVTGIQYDIAILPVSMASYMGVRNTNIIIKDDLGIYQQLMMQSNADSDVLWEAELDNIERKKSQFLFNVARYMNSTNKENHLLSHRYICALKTNLCQLYRLINNIKTDVFEIPEKGFTSGDYIYDVISNNILYEGNANDGLDVPFMNMIDLYIEFTGDRSRTNKLIDTLSEGFEDNDI